MEDQGSLEPLTLLLDWAPGQTQNVFALEDVPLSPRVATVVEQGLPPARDPGAGGDLPGSEEQEIISPTSPADPDGAPRTPTEEIPSNKAGPAPVDERYQVGVNLAHTEAPKTPSEEGQILSRRPLHRPQTSTLKGLPSHTGRPTTSGSLLLDNLYGCPETPEAPTGGSWGTEVPEGEGGQGRQVPRSPDEKTRV